tara:strand:+ start:913 stop:1293 length:381 start_codon:yes stop_codon:yes gene_type:complete
MTRTVKSDSVKLDNVVIETDTGQEFTVGEIKHSNRIVKSATPKQDLSWYVKWVSSFFVLSAVMMRSAQGDSPEMIANLRLADQVLSLIGCAGWTWVGLLWKDRALIILNAVIVFALITGILSSIIN